MQAPAATRLVLSLAAVGWAVGALAADNYSPPTIDAFLKGIRSYPYVATAARRDKIRTGVPALNRCMPAMEVQKLMGNPDFGYVAFRAGTSGRVPSNRIWNYILEKKAATETDPASRVVVWFDVSSKLRMVTVHGAPDIEASISRRNDECP